jgi:GntR family transcriptional regulator
VQGADMKIVLVNGSSTPLYRQIKNAVKYEIFKGNLSCDEQLPSIRELPKELNASIITLKKAYNELKKEGQISVWHSGGGFCNTGSKNH